MTRVYKILPAAEWAAAVAAGRFDGSAIDREDGFIHLSAEDQVQETARLHFRGQSDLVLVTLDSADLGGALVWEPSRGGRLFPHLRCALDPALARGLRPIPLDADGAPRLGLGE